MASGFNISGIDVYKIKTLSGVDMKSDWEVVKEFDFTQASGSAFVDSTPQSFGGVNWTAENISACAGTGGYIQFIKGTGLQIYVTGAGAPNGLQNLYHTYTAFPLLGASVSDIYPDFDETDTLCFQAILTSSFNGYYAPGDAQNPGHRLAITNGESGFATSATWYAVGGFQSAYTSSNPYSGWISRAGGGTTAGAGDPSDTSTISNFHRPTYLELVTPPGAVYIGGGLTTGSTGKDVTSFPRPLSTTEFRSYGTMQELQPSYVFQNPGGSKGSTQHYQGSGHGSSATIWPAGPPQWGLRPSNMTIAMMGGITVDPYDVLLPGGVKRTTFDMGITITWKKLRVLKRTRND